MSIAPLTFTGVSSFSTDFQTILSRAVQIASLPVTALTNKQADIQSEKVLAANLNSAISSLSSSLGTMASLGTSKAAVATSTDSAVVTATVSGASAASYSITNVTSIARAASETSLVGYAGMQATAAYTPLTGDASTPDQQSVTFAIADSSGTLQSLTVPLTATATDLTLTGAVSAINTALQASSSSALRGITAVEGATAGTIAFTNNSGRSFDVTFGPESGVDTTGGFAAGTVTSTAPPVSKTGTLALNIGGTVTQIVLADGKNNVAGLSEAINNLNLGVTASVLTTGSGTTPNYLTLSANKTGLTTMTLVDDPSGSANNILTETNQGANTVFRLNGLDITRSSTSVSDLVSGVTFNFKGLTAASQTVDVSVASDETQLSAALKSLVTNYNTLSGLVNAQIGPAAGLLSGNSLITQTRQAMFALLNSSGGSGSVKSLSDLGIEMSNAGAMSFNSTTFDALDSTQISDAFNFLASNTAGPAKMQAQLKQLCDPLTGAIKSQQDTWDAADKRITESVADLTARITTMQTALQLKLQKADSLLASLASTQSLLTASIQSLNYTSYGYSSKSLGQ
jgi:flagellar hook-associated protein 2